MVFPPPPLETFTSQNIDYHARFLPSPEQKGAEAYQGLREMQQKNTTTCLRRRDENAQHIISNVRDQKSFRETYFLK